MIYLLATWLLAPFLWWRASRRQAPLRRILVIQTAKIGDFVATTPVFRALRSRLPEVEIVALLHPVNEPLARGLDSIDRIVTLPKNGFKGWAGKRWLWDILSEGVDGVLILSPNLTNLLVPFWAGVPRRVSVLPDRRQGSGRLAWPFLTHGEQHRAGLLFRDTALSALSGLGIPVDAALLATRAEVPISPQAKGVAEAVLSGVARPCVGLGLGAGNRMKALDGVQQHRLLEGLLSRTSASVILIGTDADRSAAAALCSAFGDSRLMDTTGQWSLADLPALLAQLDCFVGVDSGATYIADAVGVPVIDFMGPADADDQRPLGPHAVVLRSGEPCAPCSHAFDAPYQCKLGTRACIAQAPIDALVAAVVTQLHARGVS